jgi:4-hydroxy-tetrahydrodipicolinate synthase
MATVKGKRVRLATGVISATLTPMRADGAPDLALLASHCRRLLDGGCTAIVLLGTTGEANSFTQDERRSVLERLVTSGIRPEDLIVGTGCCAVADTIALSRHALSLGVTRVLVLPPFYYKKVSDDGIFDAYARAIEGIADDRLRCYLYKIPQMSGVDLSVALVERLWAAYPTAIAGLKDSSGDWSGTHALRRADRHSRRHRNAFGTRGRCRCRGLRQRDRQRQCKSHRRIV